MSRRLYRLWLLPALLLASQSWALGLGDIRLTSALNEPLRAEVDLLSATDEELKNLTVQLASIETFGRYDLERPLFLTNLRFDVIRSGRVDGNIVRITSTDAVTEPFLTILVEAAWSRGRLLREYTLLLDPPTFAPPPARQSTQVVTAPAQAAQTDRGQISRPAPQQSQPTQQAAPPAPVPAVVPRPGAAQSVPAAPENVPDEPDINANPTGADDSVSTVADDATAIADDAQVETSDPQFDTSVGGDMVIQRGDTLWSIAQRMRPDSRLTVQQTMLAIYETNPDAFAGNINRMSAGATLQIPSASDVFRISRNDAIAEVQRQNSAWGGVMPEAGAQPQRGLTLVPPDDDVDLFDDDDGQSTSDSTVVDLVDADEARISEIEAQLLDHQNSLIEINASELAVLRAELARLRGEEPPEPVIPVETIDEAVGDDAQDPIVDDTVAATDPLEDATLADDTADEIEPPVTDTIAPPVVSARPADDGLLDSILGIFSSFWVWIGAAILAAGGLLVWFARRPGATGQEESTGLWETIDEDEFDDSDTQAATARLRAMAHVDDTSIVVVEQDSASDSDVLTMMDTLELPAARAEPEQAEDEFSTTSSIEDQVAQAAVEEDIQASEAVVPPIEQSPLAEVTAEKSLEDTFSSETAINLDQSDPIAEADFHMAYGLYDQAADLINGALEVDSGDQELLAKLCEIYFVWGNRDAFIDAAGKMQAVAGGQGNPEWDKIVIMGQQIASDHELFAGVRAGAMTQKVDLEFDGVSADAGALDLDFATDIGDADASADDFEHSMDAIFADDIELDLGDDLSLDDMAATAEIPASTEESPEAAETSELPSMELKDTIETPTIEQQFVSPAETVEIPGVSGLGPNDATKLASLDALDDVEESRRSDATAEIDLDDLGLDLDALDAAHMSGDVDEAEDVSLDFDNTREAPVLKLDDSLAETGRNPTLHGDFGSTDADVEFDTDLLDATGQTHVLSQGDFENVTGVLDNVLADDDKTMLADSLDNDDDATAAFRASDLDTLIAPLDDESTTFADDELKFDNSPALSMDDVDGESSIEETGEMPGIPGSTDMDLDLDDLTAALQVSEVGDTVERIHFADNAATVEQRIIRPSGAGRANAPDTASSGLHDARTMTEVGTKLDLARAYVDMGDPGGARSILEEVLDEGDEGQRQQAQRLLETLPS